MVDHEIPLLGDEVQKQLQHLQAMASHEAVEEIEWTGDDQTRLEEEIARIKFNPAHAPKELSGITLERLGLTVHPTNNFPMILGLVNGIRKGKLNPENPFEAAYAQQMKPRRYDEIFGRLEAEYPALYKKIEQTYQQQNVQHKSLDLAGIAYERHLYALSQAYSAAAQIALEIDPGYDLGHLYR